VEVLGELARPAEGDVVAAVDLVGLDAKPFVGVTARPGGGDMRSSRQRRYLVGVSGQAASGHGSFSAFDDSLRSLRLASAASAGGTSW
jgi:hypothetical protein